LRADPPAYVVTLQEAPRDEFRHHRKPAAPMFPELSDLLRSRYEFSMECSNLYLQAFRLKKSNEQ